MKHWLKPIFYLLSCETEIYTLQNLHYLLHFSFSFFLFLYHSSDMLGYGTTIPAYILITQNSGPIILQR